MHFVSPKGSLRSEAVSTAHLGVVKVEEIKVWVRVVLFILFFLFQTSTSNPSKLRKLVLNQKKARNGSSSAKPIGLHDKNPRLYLSNLQSDIRTLSSRLHLGLTIGMGCGFQQAPHHINGS